MEDYFQFSVLDIEKQPFKIDKPVRLIELFAGCGSQHIALEELGVDFESYRICEWAVKSIQAYKDLHFGDDNTDYSQGMSKEEIVDYLFEKGISADYNKPMTREQINRMGEQKCRTVYNNIKATHNLVSVTNITADDLNIVDTDKYCYMMTYSFPCQDLSLAGKQKGMAKGDNTRSGLLWEVERLLNECDELPQVLLMENVTQVHGKKNADHFNEWIKFLESKGYSNYWKDLNAKNFGIPQNRNRTFMVSILGNYTYEFPKEFPLELRLKDMLEDSVDEKFYLSGKMIDYLHNITEKNIARGNGNTYTPSNIDGCSKTITTKEGQRVKDNFIEEPTCKQVGVLSGGKWDKMHDVSRIVYSEEGISPTIHTCGGGNTEPKVIGGIGDKKSNGGTQWYQQDRIYDNNVAISVTTVCNPYYKVDEPTIQKADIPQTVRVRKYSIDTDKLVQVLRDHKNLSNQEIAETLNVPLTKVEHWFRKDEYFAIPDAEIWSSLKALLKIETDEFDEAITTFEEKEGVFEKTNRCYFTNGIAPTLTSTSGNEKVIEPQERFFKQALETLEENDCSVGDTIDAFNKRVNTSGVSPTITTRPEGFKTAILPVVEHNNRVIIPTNNKKGYDEAYEGDSINLEQPNSLTRRGRVGHGVAQTLNTAPQQAVVENCYVSEKGVRYICDPSRGMATDVNADICQPLTAKGQSNWTGSFISPDIKSLEKSSTIGSAEPTKINLKDGSQITSDDNLSGLRIRKLTPKECWRLQGVKDEYFDRVAPNQSNSSLYHLAGDSICVPVIYYIFKQMFRSDEQK